MVCVYFLEVLPIHVFIVKIYTQTSCYIKSWVVCVHIQGPNETDVRVCILQLWNVYKNEIRKVLVNTINTKYTYTDAIDYYQYKTVWLVAIKGR